MNLKECFFVSLIIALHWVVFVFYFSDRTTQRRADDACLSAEVLVARELLATTGV